jgi:hypothetical protein
MLAAFQHGMISGQRLLFLDHCIRSRRILIGMPPGALRIPGKSERTVSLGPSALRIPGRSGSKTPSGPGALRIPGRSGSTAPSGPGALRIAVSAKAREVESIAIENRIGRVKLMIKPLDPRVPTNNSRSVINQFGFSQSCSSRRNRLANASSRHQKKMPRLEQGPYRGVSGVCGQDGCIGFDCRRRGVTRRWLTIR